MSDRSCTRENCQEFKGWDWGAAPASAGASPASAATARAISCTACSRPAMTAGEVGTLEIVWMAQARRPMHSSSRR